MKIWQKLLATAGVVFVAVCLDVLRMALGIVLGGFLYMLFMGIVLILPVSLIWRMKTVRGEKKPKAKNKEQALALKILKEREKEREAERKAQIEREKAEEKRSMEERFRGMSDEELKAMFREEEKPAKVSRKNSLHESFLLNRRSAISRFCESFLGLLLLSCSIAILIVYVFFACCQRL